MVESSLKQIPLPLGIRSRPSLTNFIAGPNREAWEAVNSIASGTGERVVYLWGAEGTGKSHLLEAGYQKIIQQNQEAEYLSCRASISIRPSTIRETRKIDLICIDDIDTQVGNRDREETLFHAYNLAEANGTRLLVAGKQNPAGADFSLPDLGSRFAAGLVLRLHPLDDDGRRMAIKCRAEEWGFTFPDRVIAFLLRRYQRDMHSLFVLLEEIDQATLVKKRPVTIPFVRDLLETFQHLHE
uniref:Regulatory inactivation of DnaA Hda protein n=1 Tax=Candidatus Kentrum sp. TUN TaxID=2126343 RepID=A0A451A3Q2_9GAMM|nr:MAG: regulatory inactivation of DnaA Hda protein [Candidatus Kentron sp. TUN]VFK60665.1 MAG: regulatory inactivation of DnaA Hda protein [Candidatus Kentron sp. TUN]